MKMLKLIISIIIIISSIIIYFVKKEKVNKFETKHNTYSLTEKDLRWNQFIDEICYKDISELNEIQKNAVLCFWYDAEMGSGGHSGYMDCYPDTNPKDLIKALKIVGNKEIANNYAKAVSDGEEDDFIETDTKYEEFSPSLSELLQEYVENNKEYIFDK